MNNLQSKYENLIEEERLLADKIESCEECVEAILDYIAKKANTIHVLTAEEIVSAVHAIGKDLRTELLHVKLERSIVSNKLSGVL
ncbi:hypothetical protein [Paenibacillus elgii]|uniref:hypothetical protein n=1 Tax=Paenibacillus elgii TaxID=189691 RepID=UPI00203B0B7F|nr:hypothetical protein [Paenibacillus elgii]MCM3269995.1 hypothetical protein [Paenibacillus elgii]